MYKTLSPINFKEEIVMIHCKCPHAFSIIYVLACSIWSGVYFFNPYGFVDNFPQAFAYIELAAATFAFISYALDRLGVLDAWKRGKNLFYIAMLTFWILTAPHVFLDSYRKIAEPHRDAVVIGFMLTLLIPCYWMVLTRFLSKKKVVQFILSLILVGITFLGIHYCSN
ncbi:hypothetical protein ACLHDD_12660 [Pantoea sp. NSTU24]|uniref:hypothetical protein n=1 Tax=Pantoea sp. NSTU24 TaxID=3391144 RepID=UPI003D03AD1F